MSQGKLVHKFSFVCPACYAAAQIEFSKKPKAFQPTILKWTCESCDSVFQLAMKKESRLEQGQFGVTVKLMEISERGKACIEAAEAKKKTQLKAVADLPPIGAPGKFA